VPRFVSRKNILFRELFLICFHAQNADYSILQTHVFT
jgi:hypothetical protein